MNFAFSEEQEELRKSVRRFLESKSPESAVRELMETEDGCDPAVWSQMAEQMGLQGLHVPEEYGGSGFSHVELGIVLEEMGRALLCAPFFSTVVLAALGALVTTLAAVPVAWLAVRYRGRITTLVERSTYVANALPGIVVGLALVVASLRLVPLVYQTALLLVVAYAILFLPRAVVTVRAGLEQAPVVLDHVARVFEPGVRYPERDVNAMLGAFFDDYAALRRYLVDEGFLARDAGTYWLQAIEASALQTE